MKHQSSLRTFVARFSLALVTCVLVFAHTANAKAQAVNSEYTANEIVFAGHKFFGATSGGLATAIENIFSTYGLPNGYILGQEGSGAIVGGLTYGEGVLYTKNAGDHTVFWQGPSIGWDFGGEGARTMMLVYNLASVEGLHGRYGGVAGSAYLVAGVGVNVLKRNNVMLVPVRTGVGARLGVSVGYLKLTNRPTWNPF
ncbi:MAG: EipA family protein [Pseudomonadota bacterium]